LKLGAGPGGRKGKSGPLAVSPCAVVWDGAGSGRPARGRLAAGGEAETLMKLAFRAAPAAVALAVLLAAALPARAEPPNIKPGEWEMTVESGGDGGPGAKPEISVDKTCITPDQVREADFAAHFTQMEGLEQQGLRCTKKDETATAAAYKGAVTCPLPAEAGGGTMTTTIDASFGGTRLDMTITMMTKPAKGQAPVTVTTKMRGRYLGACTPETQQKLNEERGGD
jgi:hypothetical protein